jgi:hypothetical protein
MSSRVARIIDLMDGILERGRDLDRRYEGFCRQHGIVPGTGEQALLSPALPPGDREVHRRLLELRRRLYDELLPSPTPRGATSAGAAARALGSRTRI